MRSRVAAALVLLGVTGLVLTGCGDDDDDAAETTAAETTEAAEATTTLEETDAANACDALVVGDAFLRLPPAENTGMFFSVTNESDVDTALVGAHSDLAETHELHETYEENGMMSMRPVEGARIEIPAGETVELKPGGLHVMLVNLTTELVEGESYEVTLEFEGGCEKVIDPPVQQLMPMAVPESSMAG